MSKKKKQQSKKKQSVRKKGVLQQKQQIPLGKPSAEGQPRGQRLLLFWFVLAIVMPILMIFGIEMGLRLFGYGVPTGFTFQQKIQGKASILSNPYFTRRFFEAPMARPSVPFKLSAAKSKGTYRVFVLGGSAAQGAPVPAYGITRMLDVMLKDQYPGVNFEVVNAAITAINSHVVLPIARDCSQLDADLFIIYLGNNEVVGPYGAGTVFSPLVSSLPLIRASIALKKTRLGQLIPSIAKAIKGRDKSHTGVWRGMEMFLNHQVRASDPGMQVVYRHFENNLLDIFRIAQKSNIPAIVTTVGVNLKDCPPFASLHRTGLPEEEINTWDKLVREGEALREKGDLTQAVVRFLRAEEIDAEHAELHYRLGRSYWEMGKFEKSRSRYIQARELDALRFRADTQINEIIRKTAEGKSGQGIHFVDAQQVLESNSPGKIPGSELLYEHVHLNFKGAYLVARAIFKQVQQLLPDWIAQRSTKGAVLSEQHCALRLAYSGWDRLIIAKDLLRQFQRPPFTNQLDIRQQTDTLSTEIEALERKYTADEGQQEAIAQYKAALSYDNAHWRLHDHFASFQYDVMNDPGKAEKHLRQVIQQTPQSSMALWRLGEALTGQGKHASAEEYYRQAMLYDPMSTWTLLKFGTVLLRQARSAEAIDYLAQAIKIDPGNAEAHSTLASAMVELGKPGYHDQVVRHFKKAIEIDPDFTQARENLATFYAKEAIKLRARRENDRARELLQKAVELSPERTIERYNLAFLLNKAGHRKEAIHHLAEILRIEPNHKEARKLLRLLSAVSN